MHTMKMDLARMGIDLDGLNKGDELSEERLTAMLGSPRAGKHYTLALLALRSVLSEALTERGKPATVAIVNGALRILTDEEAASYNHRTFRHGLRKARRAFERLLNVDTRGLDEPATREHRRNIEVDGKILAAVSSTRAQCRRMPLPASNGHQRTTPGLPVTTN